MALMEILYLSWLLADEEIDGSEECEGKKSWYTQDQHFKFSGIVASEVILTLAESVLHQVAKNKKIGLDTLQKMRGIFVRIWDETRYGFYKDINAVVDINDIDKINCIAEEINYLNRIELIWGSHFEGGIKLALSLFDVDEEKIELFGKIGRIWGKMLKIRVDIIDIVGDEKGLGRKPCEDIIVSDTSIKVKMTLPIIRYICEVKRNGLTVQNIKGSIGEIKQDKKIFFIKDNEAYDNAIEEVEKTLQLTGSEIINLLNRLPDTGVKASLFNLISLVCRVKR